MKKDMLVGMKIIKEAQRLGRYGEIGKMNYKEMIKWAKENNIQPGVIKK